MMGALSLSVSALVGCGIQSPTPLVPGTDWDDAPAPIVAAGPAAVIAPTGAPVAERPAVIEGVASFRGEVLAGYDVLVFNALTGETLVPAGALKTDAAGHFRVEVTNMNRGNVIRVQVASGYAGLETLVYGDKVSEKQYFLLSAGSGITVDEFSTLRARVMNGLLSAAQLLNAQSGSPILQRAEARLEALHAQFNTAMAQNPTMGNRVVEMTNARTYSEQAEFIKILIDNMSMRATVTDVVQDSLNDIVTTARDAGARTHLAPSAFTDAFRHIVFVGTSLTGAIDLTASALTVTDHHAGSSTTMSFPPPKETEPASTQEQPTQEQPSQETVEVQTPSESTEATTTDPTSTNSPTTDATNTPTAETPVTQTPVEEAPIVVTPVPIEQPPVEQTVNNGNQGNDHPNANANSNATEGSLNAGDGAGNGNANTPNANANQNANSSTPPLSTEVAATVEQPAPLQPGTSNAPAQETSSNTQASTPANNGQSSSQSGSTAPSGTTTSTDKPKGNSKK
jgi:hypothetical protein